MIENIARHGGNTLLRANRVSALQGREPVRRKTRPLLLLIGLGIFAIAVILSTILDKEPVDNVALIPDCYPDKESIGNVILVPNYYLPGDYASYAESDNKTRALFNILQEPGDVYLKINGKSMEPTIYDGQICKCVPKNNYVEGDIITFYTYVDKGTPLLVSHRINRVFEDYYLTKGDNNRIRDEWKVLPEQVFCEIQMVQNITKILSQKAHSL